MQIKTMNRILFLLPLLLTNILIVTVVRPFNPLGILVMNVAAITITGVMLRILGFFAHRTQKQGNRICF